MRERKKWVSEREREREIWGGYALIVELHNTGVHSRDFLEFHLQLICVIILGCNLASYKQMRMQWVVFWNNVIAASFVLVAQWNYVPMKCLQIPSFRHKGLDEPFWKTIVFQLPFELSHRAWFSQLVDDLTNHPRLYLLGFVMIPHSPLTSTPIRANSTTMMINMWSSTHFSSSFPQPWGTA